MKKLLFAIIAAILTMVLFSCEKEKDTVINGNNNNNNTDNSDFYYEKYQISGKVYFLIDEVSYNTENGVQSKSFSGARSFEQVCGPVSKGFVARITLTEHRGAPESNATTISVSKNNGPFAMKASGQYSATYTIDF